MTLMVYMKILQKKIKTLEGDDSDKELLSELKKLLDGKEFVCERRTTCTKIGRF